MKPTALDGCRVLDLSRVLAGPSCTQWLGDLGAEVIKVERPGLGDDTRRWGPPYLMGPDGPLEESAYYISANRNKRSITIDFTKPKGAALVADLASECDVLVENFKVGALARRGLDYETLRARLPALVYCSITGFGQTGPRKHEPGYDFLAQAMAGTMSVTGEVDGEPMKVGTAVADQMCGAYATIAILAALRHRDRTGHGQHIDLALFDSTLSWLGHVATNSFVSGEAPERYGNAHPNIVPYRAFRTADGWVVIACGNDGQFERLARALGTPSWVDDARFATNPARVAHRAVLVAEITERTRHETTSHWIACLREAGVPAGPVNSVPEAFADRQAKARQMRVSLPHPIAGEVPVVANPVRMSETPPRYTRVPPARGAHTDEILSEHGFTESELAALRADGVIE